MKKAIFILILVISQSAFYLNAQDWPKSYSGMYARWFTEHYDKGYFITGPFVTYRYSKILKTDINGNLIWEKYIGNGSYICIAGSIEPLQDGGFIISGQINKYDDWGDPFLVKYSACGEVEWCNVINTPNIGDFAWCVKPTPYNEYVMLTIYSDPNPNNHTQLFKFDCNGDLIWRQNYPAQGLAFEDLPKNIFIDATGYLISGVCYYPDPGMSGGYERPYYIRTDSTGTVLWSLAYGSVNGFHGSHFYATLKSVTNNYYSITRHSNSCDKPALIKFTDTGEESYYKDLCPEACPGGFSYLNRVNDSSFIISLSGYINNQALFKWVILDTNGNIKNERFYTESWITNTWLSLITEDLKVPCLSNNGSQIIYFYKLNSSLEFDSIYTMPIVYDSLCPYPIESDYFDPDCGLIVNIKDPQTEPDAYSLSIYPNPATDKLTIVIPGYLQKQTGPAGFNVTTVYHKWGPATLEAYDLSGKKISEQLIRQGAGSLEIDVSRWQPGMYLFRLVYQNQPVAEEKVMINY